MQIGTKINKLTLTSEPFIENRRKYGMFLCECGATKRIRIEAVQNGHTKSCGCANKNKFSLKSSEYEKLYNTWANMKKRCYDENSQRYYTYGKRGIKMCQEWKENFISFAEWALKNGWKPEKSIERINVDDNYSPENCTFISMKEQARNKTNCIFIIIGEEKRCLSEWCEIKNINYFLVHRRYQRGIRDSDLLFYDGDLRDIRKARRAFS